MFRSSCAFQGVSTFSPVRMAYRGKRPFAVLSDGPRSQASPLRLAATLPEDPFADIDGDSRAIRTLKGHMQRVAHDPFVTVLIRGESGTGKERVASAIHRVSPRQRAPFVVVNCAGLSPTLVEDELFGHVRGAFTGAISDRRGPFERATGGTVFLDEVGELTQELQMKLLRALQQRTVQRLGGEHEAAFDVRVIAATNVDLPSAVASGKFREDLYYRLKVYELCVPPLRARGAEDLRTLVNTILTQLAERRRRPVATVDAYVFDLLARYTWPGNVRELENTLERMLVAAEGTSILTGLHLPDDFEHRGPGAHRSPKESVAPSALPSRAEIDAALARHGSRFGRAARDLGLSRHQLYRLLRRQGPSSTDHTL